MLTALTAAELLHKCEPTLVSYVSNGSVLHESSNYVLNG